MAPIDYLQELKKITASITNGTPPKDILRNILDAAVAFSGGTMATLNLKPKHLECIIDVDNVSQTNVELGERAKLISDYPKPAFELEDEESHSEKLEPHVYKEGSTMVLKFKSGEIKLLDAVVDEGHETRQKLSLTILADLIAGMLRNVENSKEFNDRTKKQELIYKQLLKQNRVLRTKTMIDDLTGLHNRSFFERSLLYELERYQRYQTSIGIIMFDIDHFKEVNDVHGHSVGDDALRHLAMVAKNTVRSADIIARYGGEEFVVLLPHTTSEGAAVGAERLRCAIENNPLVIPDGHIKLTVSLGVAVLSDGATPTPDDMLRSADRALYRAKNGGRNQVAVADDLSH